MLKIAEMRNDVMGRFHNALYLGDVRERLRILEDSGAQTLPELAMDLAQMHLNHPSMWMQRRALLVNPSTHH